MSYTFELNNERKDANFVSGKVNGHSVVVEIFTAMTNGKDLAPYGKKADVAAKYIKDTIMPVFPVGEFIGKEDASL